MKKPSQEIISIAWKTLSVAGFCALLAVSGLFRPDKAEASYLLEKRCVREQSKKRPLSERKKICTCVAMNLENKLSKEQMKQLEKIYESKRSRDTASKDDHLKALVDMDFEVHTKCLANPLWQWPAEDLGKPDPLKADVD